MTSSRNDKYQDAAFGGWRSPCFFRILPYIQTRTVLDVGCGDGTYLECFSDESIGMDIAIPNLETCKAKGLSAVQADLNNRFPFPDAKFGAVFCSHVLEHVEAPLRLLKECYRVLQSDGYLVICVPNEVSIINLSYSYFDQSGRHLYAFSRENIQVLLRESGFIIEQTYPDVHTMKTQKWHLTGLLDALTRLPSLMTRPLVWAHWTIARKP